MCTISSDALMFSVLVFSVCTSDAKSKAVDLCICCNLYLCTQLPTGLDFETQCIVYIQLYC